MEECKKAEELSLGKWSSNTEKLELDLSSVGYLFLSLSLARELLLKLEFD